MDKVKCRDCGCGDIVNDYIGRGTHWQQEPFGTVDVNNTYQSVCLNEESAKFRIATMLEMLNEEIA